MQGSCEGNGGVYGCEKSVGEEEEGQAIIRWRWGVDQAVGAGSQVSIEQNKRLASLLVFIVLYIPQLHDIHLTTGIYWSAYSYIYINILDQWK